MKTITRFASVVAVALVAVVGSVHAATVTPFVQAEATLTDSGLKNSLTSVSPTKYSKEVGAGVTVGVRINQRHEVSLSSGYVDFTGKPAITPGFVSVNSKVEQVPVLLNYRYHLPVDAKNRFTVFAGPSVGIIHQKTSIEFTALSGGVPPVPPSLMVPSHEADTLFAYGATAGIDAKLSKHWTLGASAQVLEVAASSVVTHQNSVGGPQEPWIDFKSALRPTFALTVGYSW